MVNTRAILYGFLTSVIIGILSGVGLPFTDAALPTIGAGLSGLLAGGVAGYVNNRGSISNALHGVVATSLGAVLVVLILAVLGTLATGFLGLGVLLTGTVLILVTAIPGLIGGIVGGILNSGKDTKRARPAA